MLMSMLSLQEPPLHLQPAGSVKPDLVNHVLAHEGGFSWPVLMGILEA